MNLSLYESITNTILLPIIKTCHTSTIVRKKKLRKIVMLD